VHNPDEVVKLLKKVLNRKEFEETLKRALEIQNNLEKEAQDSYSLNELNSAAERLKLSPEAVKQALIEVERKNRKYSVSGKKEAVIEDFLKNFLIRNSAENIFSSNLKVNNSDLNSGNFENLKVFHPHFPEIDAEVSFQDGEENSTVVFWNSNKSLSWRTVILSSVIPVISVISAIMWFSGSAIIAADTLLISFFVSIIFLLMFLYEKKQVERNLEDYFESVQTIDKIRESQKKELELLELREQKRTFETIEEDEPRQKKQEQREEWS
jgi:uncharacterized membrane protein YtjA (UPF0391 family)